MNDPVRVRVRKCIEHLRRGLDGRGVVELARAKRLAKRPPGHVLVGDVHVPRVPPEPIGALAGTVPKPCRRLRLSFRARRGLSLARDDLQRDVESVLLVAGEPDGSRSPASERSQRPVTAKHELALGNGWDCVRHRLSRVGGGPGKSFTQGLRRGYGLE